MLGVAAVLFVACSPSDGGSADAGGSPTPGPDATVPVPAAPGVDTAASPDSVAPVPTRCVEPDGADGPVTVTIWEILGGDEAPKVFDRLVADFNASQTAVRIEVESAGGANDLLSRLPETPPAQWPDLLVATPQAMQRLLDTGRIVAPRECPGGQDAESGLLPVVRAAYSVGGQLRAVPFGVSTSVLFFDAAEMRAAGLDPASPPTTLDQLFAASRQIVDSGVSPHGLVVYDWMAYYLLTNGVLQRGELLAQPDNGRSSRATSVVLDTPANVAALTWLLDVVDAGGAVSIGVTPSGVEDLTRIIDPVDGATMSVHTSAALGDVIRLLEAGSFPGVELGVGPMPGPSHGAVIGGNGLFLVDHGDPARVGAAFRVVQWLTDPANLAAFDAATGYIPPSFRVAAEPVLVEAWARYPQMRVAWDQVIALPGNDATGGAVFGPSTEVERLFWSLTDAVVARRVPPDEALRALTDEINILLERYDAVVAAGG